MRVEDGKTLTTDGPFVEIKEAIGGYLSSRPTTSTRRSSWPRASPPPAWAARSRCARSWSGEPSLEQAFRDEWGRVLATLIGFLGDFELAEEAAQEAFAIAAERWPRDGTPANPRAWLVTTARNRAIDRIRRDRTLAEKTRLLEVPEAVEDTMDETAIPDERLELIFTCCHPALALDAQVALTLRTLGGLDHRRDRARVPRARADDGQAARAREAEDPRPPASRSGCRRRTCCRTASPPCWRSST